MRAHFGRIDGSRLFGLAGASALALLVGGCGWFDSTPQVKVVQSRPGAERSVPAGGLQGSGSGRQYDGEIRPVDESRTAPIGSVIADKGGQKAQLDAAAKDAAERDSAAREATAKRKAETAVPPLITPVSAPPVEATPGMPALPETTTPMPPPGPVTQAPIPAPAAESQTAIPAPAPAPASPAPPSPATPSPTTTQ